MLNSFFVGAFSHCGRQRERARVTGGGCIQGAAFVRGQTLCYGREPQACSLLECFHLFIRGGNWGWQRVWEFFWIFLRGILEREVSF